MGRSRFRITARDLLAGVAAVVLAAHILGGGAVSALQFRWFLVRNAGCNSDEAAWLLAHSRTGGVIREVLALTDPDDRVLVTADNIADPNEIAFYGFPRRVEHRSEPGPSAAGYQVTRTPGGRLHVIPSGGGRDAR